MDVGDAFGVVFWEHAPAILGLAGGIALSLALNPAIIHYQRQRIAAEDLPESALGTPAWRMACMERVFYIWAVMFQQYHLIAGWIVLKAFSEWLETANIARNMRDDKDKKTQKKQSLYDIYLEGNALSLLVGLLCGSLGKWIELAYARHWGLSLPAKTAAFLGYAVRLI
jgi:hypothetical protein